MKFVIQRVKNSSVAVDGETIGKINQGFMVLVGVSEDDTTEVADKMIAKLLKLRVFQDENDKMNLSIKDICGELLIISQFTLYADCRKGNRPSFVKAGCPEMAEALYEYIIEQCKSEIPVVEHGKFGADMKVSLINDGPVTIVLDSSEL